MPSFFLLASSFTSLPKTDPAPNFGSSSWEFIIQQKYFAGHPESFGIRFLYQKSLVSHPRIIHLWLLVQNLLVILPHHPCLSCLNIEKFQSRQKQDLMFHLSPFTEVNIERGIELHHVVLFSFLPDVFFSNF